MALFFKNLFGLFYCFCIITASNSDFRLDLVQVLFRHGARSPNNVNLDINNFTLASMYRPLGLGHLTEKGKQQEYAFGKFLRSRYGTYLGDIYNSEDVYARSNSSPRLQMSLQLLLAGLYPPKNFAIWNPRLKWSPIPYSIVPASSDILMESYKTPIFRAHIHRVMHSDEFQSRLAKYSDFFKFIQDKTILKKIGDFWTEHSTFDVLIANEFMNLPLPDWYTPEVREKFMELEEILHEIMVSTLEQKRLGVGMLIKTFIQNMNLNGTTISKPKKIYLYSGHDANIAMFTRAHNIKDFSYPDFGSALIFEKLKDSGKRVYVRLLAWDGSGGLITLKLNNKEFCPIEDYLKIVQDIIPSDESVMK